MSVPPTSPRDVDRAVEVLGNHKDTWAWLPVPDRIALLQRCIDAYLRNAREIVALGCEAKGLDPGSAAAGEEWMSGPVQVVRNLRLLAESLSQIQRDGLPFVPDSAVHRTPTGELAVQVVPANAFDRFLRRGIRIDVWMQPDVDERTLPNTMALAYRGRTEGRVALVLAAGNVPSIGAMDLLHKLFVENHVVVLKMHPINDYLGAPLERAFAPLVERGFLRIVYGGAEEGQHLVHHPGVDEVHMTGSQAVHDRIVWGDTPEEQALRRKTHTPKVTKRITSELGCVTPVIVVPGGWTDAELQYQAENVATMVAHSASCTCTAAQVVVTSRSWPQRRAFLDCLTGALWGYPARRAYYPGSAVKYANFVRTHPQARVLSGARDNLLPPATIYDLDPLADDVAYREEAWSPVVVETALNGGDELEFIEEAVRFCNERLFGTLSAHLLVAPQSFERLATHIHRAIADLRYGTVAVNHWSAVSFGLAAAPWGAYPGHTIENAGSGIGTVHNTYMFDQPLKTVLWGPFTTFPKPPWFVTHRRAQTVGRRMTAFEGSPSMWRLPGIVAAAALP